jgi:type I restriction-modification system DNA methylase subunit
LTKSSLENLEGFRVKSSLPISLFPAVPFMGQIEILCTKIEALTVEQDQYRLLFYDSIIQKFQMGKYSEIFTAEYNIEKSKQILYEKSCIGFIHLNKPTSDLFTKENHRTLKFIRDKLYSSDLNWVYVITMDRTLVFSLSHKQFLSWSTLLEVYSEVLICLSLIDPGILDLIDDEYRNLSFKNNLHALNQLYLSIYEEKDTEDSNKNLEHYLLELLKFDTFESSHNYFTSYFDSFLPKLDDISSKDMLNDVLKNLGKFSDAEVVDKIRIIDLLDISPITLLEITPFVKNEKRRGQFYTPLELTIPLILNSFQNKSSIEKISSLKILDPACGTGILIVVALEYVVNQLMLKESYKSFLSLREKVFRSNITGMDIDARLIAYCKSFFSLFINSPSIMSDSDTPIVHKNFLEDFVYNCKNDSSLVPKYDLILSNPPYIPLHSRFMKNVLSDKLRKELKDLIPDFIGKRDNLYVMFFGLALEQLIKPIHGIVSFIIDSSFLDLPSYMLIRKHLLSKYNLLYILSQYKYHRAVVDLSIISFGNSKKKDDFFLWQENITQLSVQQHIKDILDQPNFSFSIQFNPEVRKIIRDVQNRSVLLEDICRISCGLEYGSLLKTHFLSPVQETDYFKVIDGANGLPQSFVTFWVPNWRNSYVRVSKDYENQLKLNNLDKSPKDKKRVLLISGSEDRFIEPKIIIRQTASQFIATFDKEGYFGLRNLHIIHSFNNDYSPLLLLGILSSKLGTYLGRALNIIRGAGNSTNRYPQIRVGDLKRFPIINRSRATKNQLECLKRLEILVEENLKFGRELAHVYVNIWNKMLEITTELPVNSQKRFLQLINSSKKLNLLPSEVLDEITPLLMRVIKQKHHLEHNQKKIDNYTIQIYGLTKENYTELIQENDRGFTSS